MPWVRSDDDEPQHVKFLQVPIAAYGLFQAAKCYASRRGTNGFIPLEAMGGAIYPNVTRQQCIRLAQILAAARDPRRPDSKPLFEVVEGGWMIHDYLDYNPTAEQAKAKRDANRGRIQRWRNGQRNALQNADVTPPPYPVPDPVPVPKPEKAKKPPRADARSEAFEAFWAIYPRRVAKGDAVKAWRAKKCDDFAAEVIDAVERHRESLRAKGDYCPYPASWLNAERWNDETTPVVVPMLTPKTAGNADAVRAFAGEA
jgi:hypothetical protein